MTLSRAILTLGLTAMLATPTLASRDDDDDRRGHSRHSSHYSDDNDSRRQCSTAPRSSWLSLAEIEAHARKMGYTVTKIERKGSCVEVYARKDGNRHELYFNPATGKVVRWERD